MNSDVHILKLLLSKKEERFTIKKMAEALKINYRIAHEQTAKLEMEGLLKITKTGNSKICEFSGKFNEKVFEAEYSRRKDLFRNKDFLVLHNRLAELKFSFIVLLFGSHAKKAANHQDPAQVLHHMFLSAGKHE